MSERCEDVRADLLAHAGGKLDGLAVERLELHLRRCAVCRAVFADLRGALAVAKSESDDEPIADADVALLARRLSLVAPRRQRPALFVAGGVALAAAAAIVVVVTMDPGGGDPVADVAPVSPAVPVTRAAPAASLHVAKSGTFDGTFAVAGERVTVDQRAGFAAFSFRGGDAARLDVRTAAATVHVVGTLFFVDVDGGVTRIGVGKGKVAVESAGEERFLAAGERLSLDEDGRATVVSPSAAEALLDDADLVAFHDAVHAAPAPPAIAPATSTADAEADAPATAGGRPRKPRPVGETGDVGDVVFAAERVARAGHPDEARRALAAALAEPEYAAGSDVLRFEIARLDGFSLAAPEKARTAFDRLAKRGGPQMRVQAALMLCELDLARDRCAARACLERATAQGGSLAEEADRLLVRWSVRELTCAR